MAHLQPQTVGNPDKNIHPMLFSTD